MAPKDTKDRYFKNWWRKVIRGPSYDDAPVNSKHHRKNGLVFGVPLRDSVRCAGASIVYVEDGVHYAGLVPVVIAKCGLFLKNKGLYMEGAFRKSGSAVRIRQLQDIFSAPPTYGRLLVWDNRFSVHDVATLFRRFLNYLPEPVIVNDLYPLFCNVIEQPVRDEDKVPQFQILIEQLPQHHQYLLFYLLDMLSLFSRTVQTTRMDIHSLSIVFVPGVVLKADCARPHDFSRAQKILAFLVKNQESFKLPRSSWRTFTTETATKIPPPMRLPSAITPVTTGYASSLQRSRTLPSRRTAQIEDDQHQVINLSRSSSPTSGNEERDSHASASTAAALPLLRYSQTLREGTKPRHFL